MANTDGAFGLKPCGKHYGCREYGIVPGTTQIFLQDPVKKDTTGTTTGLSTVDIAADTGAILGSVVAIFDSDGLPVNYYPAGSATGYTCMVADDPAQEFEVQEDSGGAALAQADIGLNTNLLAGTGDTSTGLSGWELDSSDKATTATLQVRLHRIVQRADNALGTNAKWVVTINNHANGGHTGTVGV